MPTMFGAGSNTRHVKCACLDMFYRSGGKRRPLNTKATPILAWLLYLVGGWMGCMLLKTLKKLVNLLKEKERKRWAYLVLSHPPSLSWSNERKCPK